MAQDVFIAVYHALPRLDPGRPIKPWLKTIAYRTARDHLELFRNCRERLRGETWNPKDATLDSPEHRLTVYKAQAIASEILLDLDEPLRQVFIMHEIDELSWLEIANELKIPESTVQSRLRRARVEFEAALHRRRATDKHRFGGALPFPLFEPAALVAAGRGLLDVSPDAIAHAWGRVLRATTHGIGSKLSGLAALTPAQLTGSLVGAVLGGAVAGAGAAYAILHPSSTAPEMIISREIPLALTVPGPASPLLSVSSTSPPAAPTQASVANPAASVSSARAVKATSALSDRRAESEIIAHARHALAQGRTEVALSDLNRHAQQFPHGAHAAEREELRRAIEARRSAGGP